MRTLSLALGALLILHFPTRGRTHSASWWWTRKTAGRSPWWRFRPRTAMKFVTDNAGTVAFDAPEFFGRETGSASRPRLRTQDGRLRKPWRPRHNRPPAARHASRSSAKQIANASVVSLGAGIFAESQKLGEFANWKESGVCGSDTGADLPLTKTSCSGSGAIPTCRTIH